MSEHLPAATFLVGLAGLFVLIWYTTETMKLRKTSMEQVEAIAKPVLTLWADLRDAGDAILEMNDTPGALVARGSDAQFVVQNIGTGIALNVRYCFRSLDSAERGDLDGYLFYVLQGQKIKLPVPMNSSRYAGKSEAVFSFESIGGRRYESTITMNARVLTRFQFCSKT